MTAPYQLLLNAIVTKVNGLSLTYQGNTVTAAVKKLPTAEETLDTLPTCAVVPGDKPERDVPLCFGYRKLEYTCDVVVIGASEGEVTTGLSDMITLRDQISAAFETPVSLAVSGLYATQISYEVVVDKSILNQNYDYSAMRLTFWVRRAVGQAGGGG